MLWVGGRGEGEGEEKKREKIHKLQKRDTKK